MGQTSPADGRRQIRYVPLSEIKRADRNAKLHDIAWIKALIAEFGFVGAAIHDDRTGKIIAGHGRLESLEEMAKEGQSPPDGIAADESGAWMMPVEYGWRSRSDAEAEALSIALNESVPRGGWDEKVLAETLRDFDRDLRQIAGWDDTQFDALVKTLDSAFDATDTPQKERAQEEPEPPDEFKSYDDDIPTDHRCPKCGYEWSGKPA